MRGPNRCRRPPSGLASIEVQVAFALFGLALAGMFPVVFAQLRVMNHVELQRLGVVPAGCGFDPTNGQATQRGTSPRVDRWTRRLGLGPMLTAWEPDAPSGRGVSATPAPADPEDPGDDRRGLGLTGVVTVTRDPASGACRSLRAPVAILP